MSKATQNVDYDKQFQDDLEKAQALSLETLAMEKFRMEKRMAELRSLQAKVEAGMESKSNRKDVKMLSRDIRSASAVTASSVETSVEPRSRPRPGSFNTGPSLPKIRPPPSVIRRNSVTTNASTSVPVESDLISFHSPTGPKASDDLTDFALSVDGTSESLNNKLISLDLFPTNSNNLNYRFNSSITAINMKGTTRDIGFDLKNLNIDLTGIKPLPNTNNSNNNSNSTTIPNTSLPPPLPGFNIVPQPPPPPLIKSSSILLSSPSSSSSSLALEQKFNLNSNLSSISNMSTSTIYQLKSSSSVFSSSSSSNQYGFVFPMTSSIADQRKISLPTPSDVFNGSVHVMKDTSSASSSSSISTPHSSTSTSTTAGLDVLKVVEKKNNTNLIDLTPFDLDLLQPPRDKGVRVSLLEAFDPLLSATKYDKEPGCSSSQDIVIREESAEPDFTSGNDGDNVYDPYDPFDYLYSPPSIAGSQTSDPIYAAVVKATPITPPPLPPRSSNTPSSVRHPPERRAKHSQTQQLYENGLIMKRRSPLYDSDLIAFHKMIKTLREEFQYSDPYTNAGLVVSPTLESSYNEGTSIKLCVKCPGRDMPVSFTCDVGTTVEHVIMHVVCELESDNTITANNSNNDNNGEVDYVLKVAGLAEYLTSHTNLADYEYVRQCIKLEQDVSLVLIHIDQLQRPLARTAQDDKQDKMLSLEDLLPKEPVQPISYDTLIILLETLEREMEKVEKAAVEGVWPLQSLGVKQAIKAICSLLGSIETLEISHALDSFINSCSELQNSREEDWNRAEVVADDDDGDYSVVRVKNVGPSDVPELVSIQCDRIRDAVQGLIETYCNAFRVDFQLKVPPAQPIGSKLSSEVLDSVLVHIECLHRLKTSWHHQEYLIAGQLYHGTRPVGHPVLTKSATLSKILYDRVVFDFWLNFEGVSVCIIPRECRLVMVIYGRTEAPAPEGAEGTPGEIRQVELGWAAIQFFNYDGVLTQGRFLLSVWPPSADKRLGPAPAPGTHPHGDTHPVLGIELPDYGGEVIFPPTSKEVDPVPLTNHDFDSLDCNTQQQLIDICEQDTFSWPQVEDREVLWEKRHYLLGKPQALPKVFLAAHSWDYACLADLYSLLHLWTPLDPVSALQLLLPCFPDCEVRRVAVSWVRELSSDELCDYLPQLVEALKHETYEASTLTQFLLQRALTSPRVAHHLYWLLTQALPGECPQNSSANGATTSGNAEDDLVGASYHRRLQLVLRALLAISGEALRQRFMSQQLLVKDLYDTAEAVKSTKESLRLKTLSSSLEGLHSSLQVNPTCLPLSPSVEVTGIQIRSSSYFASNTLPLKINFISADAGATIPAIFKVGDDLQQDMLTLQMIRIMDKMWLKEGLDLKMVTFACVPTGYKRGMIEMVTEAETLRKIQVELGLTGSFKDRPIAEWLAKHNPSALEYERAVANFTASCAGYSVATYVLGICDRHNDNIMLKTSGHLFHIDFGKFLGDAQMFGNFKRDRTPFVLTSDMAYVINGGDKPSVKFQHFVDLCCQAFNIVRKHGNLLLNLFGLMASSGIPGVTVDAVRYVQRALLPELSNPEAAATFARMIQSSLKSWFTQFNFFLHNLAQLRFSGENTGDGELLSFVPRTYSLQQEGRLKSVEVYGYQKRYDPEKYYVYILKVERVNQPDPAYLFRSFKEFVEFQQKLCILFPLAKCHSLLGYGLHVGRSNIKIVAEKRRHEIKRFLSSLFQMADEICHSDLVYTFFHPLLRDQQEASIHEAKLRERKKESQIANEMWRVKGQIRLSVHYQRGTLMIMVHHVRDLSCIAGGQEPSTYVKVYLMPDPGKVTKRKTKVVKRSCHPSFMEMLEYRMPIEIVQHRTLEATVWNHDPLQENEFLGGILIHLNELNLLEETDNWYTLGNIHR